MTMEKLQKISTVTFFEFKQDYLNGMYPHERFGQAFLNIFYPDEIHPQLFYEENRSSCIAIIFDIYVDYLFSAEYGKKYVRRGEE